MPLSVASEPSPTPLEPIGSWPRAPFSPFAIAFGSGMDDGGPVGGRLGFGDAVDRDRPRREQGELVEAAVGVDLGDRLDPRLAAAARVGQVVDAGVGQVAVVSGDVAADALLHLGPGALRRRLGEQALDLPRVDDPLVEEVGVEVARDVEPVAALGVADVGSEVARALGAHGHVGVRDRADVVPGEGVAVSEPEAAPVLGEDVRDPVLVGADVGLELLRGGGLGEHQRSEADGEDELHGCDANRPAPGVRRLPIGGSVSCCYQRGSSPSPSGTPRR